MAFAILGVGFILLVVGSPVPEVVAWVVLALATLAGVRLACWGLWR